MIIKLGQDTAGLIINLVDKDGKDAELYHYLDNTYKFGVFIKRISKYSISQGEAKYISQILNKALNKAICITERENITKVIKEFKSQIQQYNASKGE